MNDEETVALIAAAIPFGQDARRGRRVACRARTRGADITEQGLG